MNAVSTYTAGESVGANTPFFRRISWGAILAGVFMALVIQLVTFVAATALIRGLRDMIEGGNVAAALVLIGIQIAVALLNAGAVSG